MSGVSMTRGRWLPMKFTCVAIHAVPEGDMGGMRLLRFITEPPPCHSSIPASAPCLCTASVISACERTSSSSQSVANGSGASSELGSIEHVAGAHDAPAALGLGAAERGAHVRHGVRHAGRMRHGIEAIAGRHRADLDGLEQYVVAGVACHSQSNGRWRADLDAGESARS